jgi:hypothetical protein
MDSSAHFWHGQIHGRLIATLADNADGLQLRASIG